jgi:hypothetical protein
MKKQLFAIIMLILIFCSGTCLAISEEERREYGILMSAVTFASDKIIGEYGDTIPDDLNTGDKFMRLIKNKIPEDYYKALKKYSIDIEPMGSYYLLLIINPENKSVILFDYSCTPETDGPVLLEPGKYDVNHLGLYDTCEHYKDEMSVENSLITITKAAWTSGVDNMKNPKEIYKESVSDVQRLYLWMRIRGKEKALEVLDSEGKLPIQHLWIYSTGMSQVNAGSLRPTDAIDLTVGKKDKIDKLRSEVNERGFFDWRTWSMKKNITKGWWLVKILYADGSPVLCDNKPCTYAIEVQ